MVNESLLQSTEAVLGSRARRILITGGTGFVGSHLARCLAEAGQDVTVLGRNRYRTHRIQHPRIRFENVDIRDASRVDSCCEGHELVYHCAALSTPWADPKKLQGINVDGTRNVIRSCVSQGISRLVHVSSTSVFFDYTDLVDQRDDAPYPRRAACPYSASKREAEEAIREAVANGLNAFTLRARAVFGEGDNALLPRLIQAAQDGRLRQIGDGENLVDLTYIDNLVLALVLAAERGQPGGICTVTNGQPVKLWEMLPDVLAELEIPYAGRRIPYAVAHFAAGLREAVHWACPQLGEPKLTRYTVGLLAKRQTFDLEAAAGELDYAPIVSMQEGLRRTIASWRKNDSNHAATKVQLQCFTTGYVTANRRFVEHQAESSRIRFHALVGLIDHPTMGLTLFDAGSAPRMLKIRGNAARLYNRLVPTKTSDSLAIASQLSAQGIDAHEVRRVIISHFHADHVAGLRDFPNAEFIASRVAWEAIRNRKSWSALRKAVLPDLFPEDFAERLHLVESFCDPGMGPFDHCHDLFGDRSVRLFELPGHAAGQIGALVQSGDETRDFLVADATWTTEAILRRLMPHPLTRSFVNSFADMKRTIEFLHRFRQQFPDVTLIPTHCPQVATRFKFNERIEELA